MTIEIDDRVALSLQKLQRQADDLAMPLHEYLDLLAEIASLEPDKPDISQEEFDAVFDELANEPDVARSLPPDFSRADIYFDHD